MIDVPLGRGAVLRGTVWPGGTAVPFDGYVVIGPDGAVVALGPTGDSEPTRRSDILELGGSGYWIGPGVIDAHVHLAFGDPGEMLRGGVVGVRDLGAPPTAAAQWRAAGESAPGWPYVAIAGPVLTAPQGYPSRTWGADGFARFVADESAAREWVAAAVASGTDLVKVALEPASGQAVLEPPVLRAIVRAAHDAGLAVTAHALTGDMVSRALDAGVDELCHMPVERLDEQTVHRIAAGGVPVVSTLQTFFTAGVGADAARNALALHRAGVPLLYGTDFGNAGTYAGVDPRELDRLADAGLGRLGAIRAATVGSAGAYGMRGPTGVLAPGHPASLVVLPADPLVETGAWRTPTAVLTRGHLFVRGGTPGADGRAGGRTVTTHTVTAEAGDRRGETDDRHRSTIGVGRAFGRDDLGVALRWCVGVAAVGAPLGWLWAAIGPHVRVLMSADGAVVADYQPEAFVGGDATFAVLGLLAGIVVGIAAWLLRRRRGPWMALALAAGAVVSSVLTWKLGHRIGLAGFEEFKRHAAVGARIDRPVDLRAKGVLFLQPIAALLAYMVAAGWSPYGDLGRPGPTDRSRPRHLADHGAATDGPRPDGASSAPAAPGAPPAALAPPSAATTSPPRA